MVYKQRLTKNIIYLAIALAFILSGCSSESLDKLWLKSPGWSRGVQLGATSMAAPAEVVIDDTGIVYSVLFPKSLMDDSLYQPELVVLDSDGNIQQKNTLDFQISQPKQARIILSSQGIDLFWIDSYQAKAIQIDRQGKLLSDVQILSEGERVNNIEVIPWEGGYIIWYAGRPESPGLYALVGKLDNLQKTLVDPEGIRVNLFMDSADHLHATWVRYPLSYGNMGFYYLETLPGQNNYDQSIEMFSRRVSPSMNVQGPVLVVDQEVAYMIWSEEILTGLDSGNTTTHFRYFPLNHPTSIRPVMELYVPASQNIEPAPYPNETFEVGNRVLLGGMIPRTPYLENIDSITTQYPETALVFRSRSEYKWRDFRPQVNIAYFSDGLLTSYQPLSYTSAESNYPAINYDQDLNLYVTWLEKGETTYRAYLTTTDPDKKANIDLVSTDDYLYLAAEGLFGILAGAVLAPFAAAAWGGIGLIAFIFNVIFSRLNKIFFRTMGEILSIAGGLFIFWWIKNATLPGLLDDYIPFSAWIPRIPSQLETPLIIGVPVLIAILSFAIAWFKTYGKGSGSPINFYLIYVALDTLMSCAVYGILIYGSF